MGALAGPTFIYGVSGRGAVILPAKESKGVFILAVLEIAGGIASIALGAYYVNTLNGIVAQLGLSPSKVPDFYVYFIGEAALGAAALPLAYGLWKGRRWGRPLTGDFSVASLVFYVGLGSYFVAQYGDYTELVAGGVGVTVSLVALFYLTRRGTRGSSGEGTLSVEPDRPF